MPTAITTARPLARQARALSPALLAGHDDPHAEWLTLVWSTRFDRAYALTLWAQGLRSHRPGVAPMGPALLKLADAYDALPADQHDGLRRLILRHRQWHGGLGLSEFNDAPHFADR